MTAVTETTRPTFYDTDGAALTMDAGDSGSGNEINAGGIAVLIAHNTDAATQTITVTSQPMRNSGRTGDVSRAMLADEYRVFLLPADGWADSSQLINITVTSANIKLGYFLLPTF